MSYTAVQTSGGAPHETIEKLPATYTRMPVTYHSPSGEKYRIGDFIVHQSNGRFVHGEIVDIIFTKNHQTIIFLNLTRTQLVIEIYPTEQSFMMHISEDDGKNADKSYCQFCTSFQNVHTFRGVSTLSGYAEVCGTCLTGPNSKFYSCGSCLEIFQHDITPRQTRILNGEEIGACENCATRYWLPCVICDEHIHDRELMQVYKSDGDRYGSRLRMCNPCYIREVETEMIRACHSCSNAYYGSGRYFGLQPATRLNGTAEVIVLEGDEEEAVVDNTEPAVWLCNNCVTGNGARAVPNVIHNYTWRPERMKFFGSAENVKGPLPGTNDKKQPYLRRDVYVDPNRYRDKRYGDWKGDVPIKTFSTYVDAAMGRKKRESRKIYPGQLYIGMELEVEMKPEHHGKANAVASKLQEKMTGAVYIKKDGSLEDGFEIVTHPGTFEWWMNEFNYRSVSGAGKYCVSYSARTCGNHFHLSKAAFTVLHLYKFAKFHYRNQEFITFIAERYSNRFASFNEHEAQNLVRLSKSKTSEAGRYLAVNMTPRDTVELRYFRGNLKKERIRKNVQFIHALFIFSKTYGIQDMSFIKFLDFVVDNRKTYPDLFDFVLNFTPEGR